MYNKQLKILYITYIDFGDYSSGSQVRPQKMYEAFLNLGHDVKLLQCQQNRRKERKEAVKCIKEWLKDNQPDLCYIESPSGPIFNLFDLNLIKLISNKDIPIGFFYRDAYWMLLDSQYKGNFIKESIISILNKLEIYYLKKYVSILYMPTRSLANIFNNRLGYGFIDILPPACDKNNVKRHYNNESAIPVALYIGGISDMYGSNMLYNTFCELNKTRIICKLILITRENEFNRYFNEMEKKEFQKWAEIHHLSGDDLIPYYQKADFALITLRKNQYQNIALPIKLFQYLSFKIPIVATSVDEVRNIVEGNSVGIICEDNESDMQNAIRTMIEEQKAGGCFNCSIDKFVDENQWENRAQKVIEDLLCIKGSL